MRFASLFALGVVALTATYHNGIVLSDGVNVKTYLTSPTAHFVDSTKDDDESVSEQWQDDEECVFTKVKNDDRFSVLSESYVSLLKKNNLITQSTGYVDLYKYAFKYCLDNGYGVDSFYLSVEDMQVVDSIINYMTSHYKDFGTSVTSDDIMQFVEDLSDAIGVGDIDVTYNYGAVSSYDSFFRYNDKSGDTGRIEINIRMPESGSMTFGELLYNEMRNILHELRHAYQYYSVFRTGFNTTYSESSVDVLRDNFYDYYKYDITTGDNDYMRYKSQPLESDARLFSSFIVDRVRLIIMDGE